jgi:5,10-methenyltetrahydromethanopterin hydrogenase
MKLREKITQRMDDLQRMMENNIHLINPDKVAIQISSVSKYWSVLDDEDRDYIHGARHALEEKTEWRIK